MPITCAIELGIAYVVSVATVHAIAVVTLLGIVRSDAAFIRAAVIGSDSVKLKSLVGVHHFGGLSPPLIAAFNFDNVNRSRSNSSLNEVARLTTPLGVGSVIVSISNAEFSQELMESGSVWVT